MMYFYLCPKCGHGLSVFDVNQTGQRYICKRCGFDSWNSSYKVTVNETGSINLSETAVTWI